MTAQGVVWLGHRGMGRFEHAFSGMERQTETGPVWDVSDERSICRDVRLVDSARPGRSQTGLKCGACAEEFGVEDKPR